MVVSAAPTSTTKITGFLARVTGFNLKNDSLKARPAISVSNNGLARANFLGSSDVKSSAGGAGLGGVIVVDMGLEQLSLMHQIMFDNGPERKRGKECQRAADHYRANQQSDEERTVGW